jgi:hypothetical protein
MTAAVMVRTPQNRRKHHHFDHNRSGTMAAAIVPELKTNPSRRFVRSQNGMMVMAAPKPKHSPRHALSRSGTMLAKGDPKASGWTRRQAVGRSKLQNGTRRHHRHLLKLQCCR